MSDWQGNRRWVIVLASSFTIFIADGCLSTVGLYLSPLRDYFGCSMAEISAIASLVVLFYHVGGLSGTVVNRLGYRTVVVVSGFMAALAMFVSSFTSSRILLGFTFGIVTGFFSGSPYPGCSLAVASYFDKNYTTVWGITSVGTSLGVVVLPPLTQYLIDHYGWRGAMVLSSGIMGQVLVSGMLLRPVMKKRRPLRRMSCNRSQDCLDDQITHLGTMIGSSISVSNGKTLQEYSKVIQSVSDDSTNQLDNHKICDHHQQLHNDKGHEGSPKMLLDSQGRAVKKTELDDEDDVVSDGSDIVKVLNLKMSSESACTRICYTLGVPLMLHSFRVALIVLSQFTIGMCFNFLLSHLPGSLVNRGVSSQTASLFISLIGIGSVVGRAGYGFLVDFGCISAKNLYGISMAILGSCVMLYRVIQTYWMYAIMSFGVGASSGIAFALEIVQSRVYVGKEHMGRAIALIFLSHGTGGCVGPILGGWAFDVTGSYDYPFYVFGGIVVLSSFMFLLEPKLGELEAYRASKILQDHHDVKITDGCDGEKETFV
ncbi:monocarboxylate transporter 14-like [Lytechinus pictus]|uniref:monocarboxylate transporter 14-like n=1 Tax=Lytechinus pictus TaxID=7653 RepID=UPI00240D6F4D|nr:monocarboxylate transporter 14-like [Lytechinus pictus]